MTELPTGTVTFLFTDVEGSTRLLRALGSDRYADVLATHNELLRAEFAQEGGLETHHQGDSFVVVFRSAGGAVRAAVAAQRALGEAMMTAVGFDRARGRLDVSHHPFCGGSPSDVRITTRYDENDFTSALMGVLHETGAVDVVRGSGALLDRFASTFHLGG